MCLLWSQLEVEAGENFQCLLRVELLKTCLYSWPLLPVLSIAMEKLTAISFVIRLFWDRSLMFKRASNVNLLPPPLESWDVNCVSLSHEMLGVCKHLVFRGMLIELFMIHDTRSLWMFRTCVWTCSLYPCQSLENLFRKIPPCFYASFFRNENFLSYLLPFSVYRNIETEEQKQSSWHMMLLTMYLNCMKPLISAFW